MQRVEIYQMEDLIGGSRCDFFAGVFGGLGAGLMYGSFIPINFVVGSIALGTSALLVYTCR